MWSERCSECVVFVKLLACGVSLLDYTAIDTHTHTPRQKLGHTHVRQNHRY